MSVKNTIVCLLLSSFSIMLSAQEQVWPKLMQRFEGENVQVRYDNTKGFWYLDWRDSVIKGMTLNFDNSRAKYLYVDSTGNPISNEFYEDASKFNGGLAVVGTSHKLNNIPPRQYAVINEKSEYLFKLSEEPKITIGQGLIMIDKKNVQEIYDRNGKMIASCSGCGISTNAAMKHILMSPRPHSKDQQVVRLLTLDGKEIFQSPGYMLLQVRNDISTKMGTFSTLQPYYQLVHQEGVYLSSFVSREGKIVLDSVTYQFFSRGKSCVIKNGLAAVIDTNFKVRMPYSYGYDFYRPLYGHPEEAYSARKNGVFRVINAKNKQLVPMELTYTEIWYKPESKLYEGRDKEGNFWYMSLKGDTVISPVKYQDIRPMEPILPGYIVRSRATGKLGYVGEGGKLAVPCIYDHLGYGGKDLFLYFKNNEAGFVDLNGNVKIRKTGILKLSAFSGGYALCGVKVTERGRFSQGAQTVMDGQETYQVHNKIMDSTGKFISDETFDWIFAFKNGYAAVYQGAESFMVDRNLKKVVLSDNSVLMNYFHNGTALAYNPAKKTWGLVNDKLQIIVPVIYEQLDKIEDSSARYSYSVATARGYDYGGGYKNYYANIIDGKLTVTLQGEKKNIEVGK